MKYEQVLAQAKAANLVDERNIIVFSNAKTLPNGEFGLCLVCLNGNDLRIYETDFSQRIGEPLYRIPLNQIGGVKCSSFVFNRYLKFEYGGRRYHLADFGDAKRFTAAVLEESAKK